MSSRVAVGEAVKIQGVRGEVRVHPWMEGLEAYCRIPDVCLKSDPDRCLEIDFFKRGGKGSIVWKFKGIDSPEAAEKLRGAIFLAGREYFPGPEDGVYYWEDFEGLVAVNESGRLLGRIVDMFGAGGNDVIVVSTPNGDELLIPAIREAVLRCEEDRWVFRPPKFVGEDPLNAF